MQNKREYRTLGLRFPYIIAIVQYFALSLIKNLTREEIHTIILKRVLTIFNELNQILGFCKEHMEEK